MSAVEHTTEMQTFLIISPESWSAHSVSKHHYAKTLAAQGHTVFFVNPPDNSLRGIRIDKVEGQPRLLVVSGPQVARGLRFYPSPLRRWREARWLKQFEKLAGRRVDTVWLFENSRFFDMRFAGTRRKIYHQVDLNQEFNLKQAALNADVCFCTTDLIKERIAPFNPRVYKIHHGLADNSLVQGSGSSTTLSAAQLARFDEACANAVYIGNLDMRYLDADLLASTARDFPEVKFHLVGGFDENGKLWRLMQALPNVVWWGKVDSSLIPRILERADILLVTYQSAHWMDQASPHKFMEYLDSGRTIVATYTDEYKDKRHLLEMVDDSGDFSTAFSRVVSNLEQYNSPELQSQRRAFAQANTYDKQIQRISRFMTQNGMRGLH